MCCVKIMFLANLSKMSKYKFALPATWFTEEEDEMWGGWVRRFKMYFSNVFLKCISQTWFTEEEEEMWGGWARRTGFPFAPLIGCRSAHVSAALVFKRDFRCGLSFSQSTLLTSVCQSGIWISPKGSSFEKVSLSKTWKDNLLHFDNNYVSGPEGQPSCLRPLPEKSWSGQCGYRWGWPCSSLGCWSAPAQKYAHTLDLSATSYIEVAWQQHSADIAVRCPSKQVRLGQILLKTQCEEDCYSELKYTSACNEVTCRVWAAPLYWTWISGSLTFHQISSLQTW